MLSTQVQVGLNPCILIEFDTAKINISVVDDIGVCPKGWKERPNTGKCYYISDSQDIKTWEEGQLMCKRHQGDIVKIDDLQEKVRITFLF